MQYNSNRKVEDDKASIKKPGAYSFTVSKVEVRPGTKGEFLSLVLRVQDGQNEAFETYASFFPNSSADYPKQAFDRFLTVLGFNQNGTITLNGEQELLGKNGKVILQKVEKFNQTKGIVTDFLEPQSYYNALCLSAGEIIEGKTDAEKFASNLEYVQDNPIKKLKPGEGAPAGQGKSAESDSDMPF